MDKIGIKLVSYSANCFTSCHFDFYSNLSFKSSSFFFWGKININRDNFDIVKSRYQKDFPITNS